MNNTVKWLFCRSGFVITSLVFFFFNFVGVLGVFLPFFKEEIQRYQESTASSTVSELEEYQVNSNLLDRFLEKWNGCQVATD